MTLPKQLYNVVNLRETEFPLTADTVYLNHASISPLPQRSKHAIQDAVEHMSNNAARFFGEKAIPLFPEFMTTIANYINAGMPVEVAGIQSTSTGMNLVAQAIDWKAGDEIIFCDVEFPSNAYPWMSLAREGVKCVVVPAEHGTLTLNQVQQAVTPQTRLVAVSAIQFFTGGRADLAAIGAFCRENNLIFAVDAIQAVGHMPIDVQAMNIDVLAAGAQKSMMALTGIGFLYVRHELAMQLQPRAIGPNATKDWEKWLEYDLTPEDGALRFMMGTPNIPGMFSVISSLRMFEELGRDAIDSHVTSLSNQLIQELSTRNYEVLTPAESRLHAGIVTFKYADTHEETDMFVRKLAEENVMIVKHQDAYGNPYVRISFHCYNIVDDLFHFLNLL